MTHISTEIYRWLGGRDLPRGTGDKPDKLKDYQDRNRGKQNPPLPQASFIRHLPLTRPALNLDVSTVPRPSELSHEGPRNQTPVYLFTGGSAPDSQVSVSSAASGVCGRSRTSCPSSGQCFLLFNKLVAPFLWFIRLNMVEK